MSSLDKNKRETTESSLADTDKVFDKFNIQPLQQKLPGKLVSRLQKTETRSMYITLYQD
jgi:hypothetical protein